MLNNPEIDVITNEAANIAINKNNEYVLVEHLLLSLIRYKPFNACLNGYGTDVQRLDNDIEAYLNRLPENKKKSPPKKTNALERVFNRAGTQAIFTNRDYVLSNYLCYIVK